MKKIILCFILALIGTYGGLAQNTTITVRPDGTVVPIIPFLIFSDLMYLTNTGNIIKGDASGMINYSATNLDVSSIPGGNPTGYLGTDLSGKLVIGHPAVGSGNGITNTQIGVTLNGNFSGNGNGSLSNTIASSVNGGTSNSVLKMLDYYGNLFVNFNGTNGTSTFGTNVLTAFNILANGQLYGNAIGLSNFNAINIVGTISTNNLPMSLLTSPSGGLNIPSGILGLVAWYKPSMTLGTNGQSILLLPDISGNNYTATSSVTPPTLGIGYDGSPILQIESGEYYTLPNSLTISSTNFSFYIRFRQGYPNIFDGACTVADFGSGIQNMLYYASGPFYVYNSINNPHSTSPLIFPNNQSFGVLSVRSSTSGITIRNNDLQLPGGVTVGMNLTGGRLFCQANGTSFDFNGEVSEVILYNRNVNDNEDNAVMAYLKQNSIRQNIIADGDSRTFGYTSYLAYSTPYYFSWPYQLQLMLGDNTRIINKGVVAETMATMLAHVMTTVVPYIDTNTWPNENIVINAGGINDFAAGSSAAVVEGIFTNYCHSVVTNGGIMIATTIPNGSSVTGANETARQTYNTWMRSNYSTWASGLIDWDNLNTTVGGPFNNATYYDADMLHFTRIGYNVMAHGAVKTIKQVVP